MLGQSVEIQGTPVAIAAIATFGIVALVYSPAKDEARLLAIGALAQLAGAAGGVAVPKGRSQRAIATPNDWGHAPANQPPEMSDRG